MITQTDNQRVVDWLQKRCPNASCPMCQTPFFSNLQTSNVILHDHRVGIQNIIIENKQVIPQPKGLTMAYLTCENCGYVILFDGAKLGLN